MAGQGQLRYWLKRVITLRSLRVRMVYRERRARNHKFDICHLKIGCVRIGTHSITPKMPPGRAPQPMQLSSVNSLPNGKPRLKHTLESETPEVYGVGFESTSASWVLPASTCICRPHCSERSAKTVFCRVFFFHFTILINHKSLIYP